MTMSAAPTWTALALLLAKCHGIDLAPRCSSFGVNTDAAVMFGGTRDCGGGFASVDGGASCFKAFCHIDTWARAEATCAAHGAHLARLDTGQQSSFAHCLAAPTDSMITTGPPQHIPIMLPEHFVWIGLNSRNATQCGHMKPRHEWAWAGEQPPLPAERNALWAPGQPNNMGGNERCVAIGGTKSEWRDLNCAYRLKFVCRLDTPPGWSSSSNSSFTAAEVAPCRAGSGTDAELLRNPITDSALWTAMSVISVFGTLTFVSALAFICCTKHHWLPRRPARGLPNPLPTPPEMLLLGVPLGARGGDGLRLAAREGNDKHERVVVIPAGLGPGDTFTVPLDAGAAAPAITPPESTLTPPTTTTVQITLPPGAVPGQQLVVATGEQQLAVTLPPGAMPGVSLSVKVPVPAGPAGRPVCNEHVPCCAGLFGCHRNALTDPADAAECCGCGISWPGPARALAKGQRRVPTAPFDGIRGFGALQVAIGHWFDFMRKNRDGTEWGGGNAVLMFFVMSGFVMMLGYGGKGSGASGVAGCGYNYLGRNFLLRRIARMGPTVWLSMLATIPLTVMTLSASTACDVDANVSFPSLYFPYDGKPPTAPIIAIDFVSHALFMSTWIFMGATNGPLWSTCAQMFCYLLFPLLVGPLHSCRNKARVVGELLQCWCWYVFLWGALSFLVVGATMNPGLGYIIPHIHPSNKLPLFCAGMLCGSVALTRTALQPSAVRERYWGAVADACSCAVTLYFVLGLALGWGTRSMGGIVRLFGEFFIPPLYALWLFSLTQAPGCHSARLLSWRPFRTLGDWSFALYCLHTPVFAYYGWARFGSAWFDATQQTLGAYSLASWEIVPCFAALFALSCAAHHFVEQPLRTWLVGELEKVAPVCGPCGKDPAAPFSASGSSHHARVIPLVTVPVPALTVPVDQERTV